MTGSTDTSLWTVYRKGTRNYCGNALPDGAFSSIYFECVLMFPFSSLNNFIIHLGLLKNQKLPANILTPTTKAADHDVPVTPEEVCSYCLNEAASSKDSGN